MPKFEARDGAWFGLSVSFIAISLALWMPGCFMLWFGHMWILGAVLLCVPILWLAGALYFGLALRNAAGAEHPRLGWAGLLCCWLVWPLGGVLLAPLLFRMGRRIHGALAIGATLIYLVVIAARLRFLPIGSEWVELLVWIVLLGLITAIAGLPAPEPGRGKMYMLPVAVLVYFLAIWAAGVGWGLDNARFTREVMRQLGYSSDWRQMPGLAVDGMPLDAEPLRSLIAVQMEKIVDPSPAMSNDDCRREVERICSEQPGFVAALEKLLAAPPARIRHTVDEKKHFWGILLPELNAFCSAARFIALEMAADCTDRAKVLRYNAELEALRDLAGRDGFLISALVAGKIEHIRFNALLRPLAAGTLTESDCVGLSGRIPDWGRIFAEGMGGEIAGCQYAREHFFQTILLVDMNPPDWLHWLANVNFLPPEFMIFQQYDYRMAVKKLSEHIRLFLAPFDEKSGLETIEPDPRLPSLLMCAFTPACNIVHWRRAMLEYDLPQGFTVLAAAFRRRAETGTMPEDLGFLPELPLEKVHKLPLIYEVGEFLYTAGTGETSFYGARVLHRACDGKVKKQNMLAVPLPR